LKADYYSYTQSEEDRADRLNDLRRCFAVPETVTIVKSRYDDVIAIVALIHELKDALRGRPIDTAVFQGSALVEIFDAAERLQG